MGAAPEVALPESETTGAGPRPFDPILDTGTPFIPMLGSPRPLARRTHDSPCAGDDVPAPYFALLPGCQGTGVGCEPARTS